MTVRVSQQPAATVGAPLWPGADDGMPARFSWRPRLPATDVARRPGPVILMYHQVADLDDDRWELAVSPRHFTEQLEVLSRRRSVVPLGAITEALHDHRLDPLHAAITFDDGYLDNLANAKPILERFALPATVFVVGGAVGQGREFWWDELDRLFLGDHALPGSLELPLADRVHRWTLRAPGDTDLPARIRTISRGRLHRVLWRRLRTLPGAERGQAIDALRAWAGLPAAVRPDRRVMTAGNLHQLSAGGLIEIGAHTATHPRLAALTPADQCDDIQQGKEILEAIVDAPVTSFSYPFGGRLDVSATSVEAVRSAGFARACTTRPGAVHPRTDPLRLPRLYVGDWSGDEFEQRLAPWI